MKRTVFGAFIVLSLTVSWLTADSHQPLTARAVATAPLSTAAQDSTEAQAQKLTPALPPTTTAAVTPASAPSMRQLPRLYVDGPYVKRTDTKAPVWLKGLNVEEFRQRNPHTFSDLYNVHGLAIVVGQEWGINLLRVAVDPESVESTTTEFETLIDFAQAHGMYVILTPFASALNPSRDDERLPVPDELVATAMGYLAARFKDRTNVLFGLWNEPHPDSIPTINYDQQWQAWMDAGIKVANAIRRSAPQSILVVPGGNKGHLHSRFDQHAQGKCIAIRLEHVSAHSIPLKNGPPAVDTGHATYTAWWRCGLIEWSNSTCGGRLFQQTASVCAALTCPVAVC